MKVIQKIISLILVLTMAMGLATTPSFAAAENTEYENSLKSGWGTSTSNFQYPSAYNTSWNRQVINFIDLVAQRTQNIYTTLGTTNSTLSDIKSRTGYIPTISDFLNGLKSNWGDSSSYFTVPSGYRGSWYGAALMLLDTIQQRLAEPLDFEFDTTTSAIIEQISTNTGISANNTSDINTKAGSILDQFAVGNHTFKVLSFGSTQYTPDNANRTISIVDNSPSSMGYIGYRAANTGSYSLYSSTVNTMGNRLSIMNNNILQMFTALYSANTFYRFGVPNYSNGTITGLRAYSIMDSLSGLQHQASQFFARMGFVLADDDTIAAKNANKPQSQTVFNNFTGSGSASASVNDFVGIKDSVSALKTSLSGGASYTQAFNILSGDSDGWLWFSNEVAESMDTTGNGNTRLRSVPDSTPYLDSYYSELSSYLGYSYNGGIE